MSGVKSLDYGYQQLAFQLSRTFGPWENHTVTWDLDNRFNLVDTSGGDPSNLFEDYHSEGVAVFPNDAEVPRMVYAEVRLILT